MKKMYIDGVEIDLGGSGGGVSEEKVSEMIQDVLANMSCGDPGWPASIGTLTWGSTKRYHEKKLFSSEAIAKNSVRTLFTSEAIPGFITNMFADIKFDNSSSIDRVPGFLKSFRNFPTAIYADNGRVYVNILNNATEQLTTGSGYIEFFVEYVNGYI